MEEPPVLPGCQSVRHSFNQRQVMNRRVLVIDDESGTRKALVMFLQHRGYQVDEAENGVNGLELFRKHHPGVVFCHLHMPRMGGLDFLKAAKQVDPQVTILMITACDEQDVILQALRLGAKNFFQKPLNFEDVTESLMALENQVIAEQGSRFEYSCLKEERKVLSIPNDLNQVSPVVNYITPTLTNYFDEQTVHGIQGALIEMIVNAIEHGNLGISYEEKTQAIETDKLSQLIQEKGSQDELSQRRVTIEYSLDAEKVSYSIEDEGEGFDISSLPDPSEPENLWLGHGRGILMSRALMDEVSYNEKGNKVTLSKNLPTLEVLDADFIEDEELEVLDADFIEDEDS